jgi:hypothetical protein
LCSPEFVAGVILRPSVNVKNLIFFVTDTPGK